MNRFARFTTAFVIVAGACYGGGFYQEYSKVTEAEEAHARCQTSLENLTHTTSHSQGLLDLYRARVELLRANYGNAADYLGKARTSLNGDAAAGAGIDHALEATRKQDQGANDLVQQQIAAIESAPTAALMAAPQTTPPVAPQTPAQVAPQTPPQMAPVTPAQGAPQASPKESPH